MIIKPPKIILTLKISIIIILFLSVFFFQRKFSLSSLKSSYQRFGIIYKANFRFFFKNRLFFSSLLKTLAVLSLLPLLIEIAFEIPDTTVSVFNWLPKKRFPLNIEFCFDQKFKTFLSVALIVS